MTGNAQIDDLLRAVGARLRRGRALETLSVALIASLSVVALLALAGRVAGEPVLALAAAAGVLACAAVTAMLAWWRGRVNALDAAVHVDAAAQLHERVSTLLCAQGAGLRTRAAEALLEDVTARAPSLEPARLAPVHWPGRTRFAAIPAALALALALAPVSLGPRLRRASSNAPAAVVLAGAASGAAGAAGDDGEKTDAVEGAVRHVVHVFKDGAPEGAQKRALDELATALADLGSDEARRVQ